MYSGCECDGVFSRPDSPAGHRGFELTNVVLDRGCAEAAFSHGQRRMLSAGGLHQNFPPRGAAGRSCKWASDDFRVREGDDPTDGAHCAAGPRAYACIAVGYRHARQCNHVGGASDPDEVPAYAPHFTRNGEIGPKTCPPFGPTARSPIIGFLEGSFRNYGNS
jgi:hypothetical protein